MVNTDDASDRERMALEAMVRAQLGLPATDHELEEIAIGIGPLRQAIEILYAVPDAALEDPALTFDPDPRLRRWDH